MLSLYIILLVLSGTLICGVNLKYLPQYQQGRNIELSVAIGIIKFTLEFVVGGAS